MSILQTRPIGNDRNFPVVCAAINPEITLYGCSFEQHKGSGSWTAGTGRDKKTIAKLLFFGPGEPLVFALRADFVATIPQLAGLTWPRGPFSVKPHPSIEFLGFDIPAGDGAFAKRLVTQVMSQLPRPGAAQAVFEAQLEKLTTGSPTGDF